MNHNGSWVNTVDGKQYTCTKRLEDAIQKLDSDSPLFIFCDRGVLVNLDHVVSINPNRSTVAL